CSNSAFECRGGSKTQKLSIKHKGFRLGSNSTCTHACQNNNNKLSSLSLLFRRHLPLYHYSTGTNVVSQTQSFKRNRTWRNDTDNA
ncbi:hypothetical protein L9F63_024068, partial [Diploptera punctata]